MLARHALRLAPKSGIQPHRAFTTTTPLAMRAYWYDNLPGDQRLPHDSGRDVAPPYLAALGITHHHLPSDTQTPNHHPNLDAIAHQRSYKNRDTIEISPDLLPGYEEKVKTFFAEHLHEDEEIRFILAGGGYFDVRGQKDDWVRIRLEKGDLMIMPPGIYHRFTTDEQNVSLLAPFSYFLTLVEGWFVGVSGGGWSVRRWLLEMCRVWLLTFFGVLGSIRKRLGCSRKILSGRRCSEGRRRTRTLFAPLTFRRGMVQRRLRRRRQSLLRLSTPSVSSCEGMQAFGTGRSTISTMTQKFWTVS